MERAVSGTSISHLIAPGASDFETRAAARGTGSTARRDQDTGDIFAGLLHKAATPDSEHKSGEQEAAPLAEMVENSMVWIVPNTAPAPSAPEVIISDAEMPTGTELISEASSEPVAVLPPNAAQSIKADEAEMSDGKSQATANKPPANSFGFTPRMSAFGSASGETGETDIALQPAAKPDHLTSAARQLGLTQPIDRTTPAPYVIPGQTDTQKHSSTPDTKAPGNIFTARSEINRTLSTTAFPVLGDPAPQEQVTGETPRETLTNIDALAAQMRADAARTTAAPTDARPVRQIAEAVQHAASNGRDSLTLRLFPEELGEVDISLRMSDGLLKISIASARPDTLVLLQNNHQMLSRALSDLGFADGTTQFEFTERRGSSSDSEEKRGSQSPHRLSGSETAHEPTQMSHRIDGVIDIRL